MSGEVHSYNLKNPMKWAEYKTMPDDLRREYLNRLRDRYNATNVGISKMLGCCPSSVNNECKRLDIKSPGKGARATPEWESFVKWGTPDRQPVQLDPLEKIEEIEQPVPVHFDGAAMARAVSEVFSPLPEEYRGVEKKTIDMVNHPPHYTAGGVECIDAIEAATSQLTGMEAVCTAQIIKYVWRWKLKNGAEDLKKAGFYLDRLINTVEGKA